LGPSGSGSEHNHPASDGRSDRPTDRGWPPQDRGKTVERHGTRSGADCDPLRATNGSGLARLAEKQRVARSELTRQTYHSWRQQVGGLLGSCCDRWDRYR
jgi:hypothetical protein